MKCDQQGCDADSTFHFSQIELRRKSIQKDLCEKHAHACLDDFRASVSIGKGEHQAMPGAVHVDFEMIIIHDGGPADTPACVYLHEVGGKRRFCVLIDGWAWWALMAQIEKWSAPHILTHYAWAETIKVLGGTLRAAVVIDLDQGDRRYDANLHIVQNNELKILDARPSDAFILAANFGSPIFVAENVFEYAVAAENE